MRAVFALLLILSFSAGAQTPGAEYGSGSRNRRAEAQVPLPQYPKPEDYLSFEVSATTPFDFFVDAKSVSVSTDDVVRYTVVAESASGAKNVSFEGMRCSDKVFRIYAVGRSDNTWSEVRDSSWQPITVDQRNVQRAVLYRDFFCPFAGNVADIGEALRALRTGASRAVIPYY
ncbi:MAG: CNP1-like family protein [Burkholderiales bacterium]|nr:CNP1-like family protein [Burkholderiales bacterium]